MITRIALAAMVAVALFSNPAFAASGKCPPSGGSAAKSLPRGSVTNHATFERFEAVHFTVTGGPRCVFVHFSANTVLLPDGGIEVRAVLDGNKELTGPVTLTNPAGDPLMSTLSFEFFAPVVGNGDHRVQIDWRSPDIQQVKIETYTLSVRADPGSLDS